MKYSIRRNIDKPIQPISIAICNDALFGEMISENCMNSGGQIMAILSNEIWTPGASKGLLQIASLRAIETRKYIVRSTINGFSSMIDPLGTIIEVPKSNKRISAFKFEVLPNRSLTFYMLYGDIIGQISIILTIFLLFGFVRSKMTKVH